MPVATPVTIPLDAPTVATAAMPLLQVPPVVVPPNVTVLPSHTDETPVMVPATGIVLTVTIVATRQPVGNVYVMSAVPEAMPVTIPVPEPIVAMVVVPLDQVPPVGVLLSVDVVPAQMLMVPEETDGNGFTLTLNVATAVPQVLLTE
jgi:hypothetical protein